MTNVFFLLAAFGITWAIIFVYIFTISKRQEALEAQVLRLEEVLNDGEDAGI